MQHNKNVFCSIMKYRFVIKEDIKTLIPKVEQLRDLTKQICEEKIKEYGEM